MCKISICIPIYEANGKGIELLSAGLESIKNQSYKNYEIVISDHSKNDELKKFCFSKINELPIKYFRYKEKYGNGPANTNNVMSKANGKYIKLLFQDDFFKHSYSLEKMINTIEDSDEKWLVSSCDHCSITTNSTFRNFHPNWKGLPVPADVHSYMKVLPSIGSPSLLLFKKNDCLKFDEKLIMYMDVDFYFELTKLYGKPIIMNDVLMTIRLWNGSISYTTGRNVDLNLEKQYIIEKNK